MNHYIKYERWTFPADKIKGGDLHLATSLLSSSLEVNSFSVYVECDDPAILDFKRNSQLVYYPASKVGMVWRVQNIERTAPSRYHITATSTLGLLTESQHYGGIYTGETAEVVIKDICGAVPVIIKTNLRNIKLYGWLPIAAARDNLSQVLFAIGATLKSDLDGVLRVENLWDGVSGMVNADHMYQESSVKYESAVTSVAVTEHQYIPGSEEKTLYEGTTLAGDVITFSEPMHSLTAEGFTILDSGANFAKLSAGTGVLRGKAYIHNTREVVKAVHDRQEPNVKTVKDATLVSFFNSDAAANRMRNFYRWRETVNAPVVYQGELAGNRLAVCHPFDRNTVVSCLQSADITLSNTLKAQEKSLVGFVPEQIGNIAYYDARDAVLESGNWVVPDGVTTIRVVLIGGGDGGTGGQDGGDAGSLASDIVAPYVGGYGGAAGVGGDSGRVYQFSLDVVPGDVYSVVVGKGGAGGVPDGYEGPVRGYGEHTTFRKNAPDSQVYSSISGEEFLEGFRDPMTDEIYALRGPDGVGGGQGGRTNVFATGRGEDGTPAHVDGDPGVPYLGGYGGSGVYNAHSTDPYATGGGGGGGAFGQRGENGSDGIVRQNRVTPGNGGNGGTAIKPRTPSRGSGGGGGHGGGGGGGCGFANSGGFTQLYGTPGKGGKASYGGDGGAGIAIIYYRRAEASASGQLVDKFNRTVLDRYGRRIIV